MSQLSHGTGSTSQGNPLPAPGVRSVNGSGPRCGCGNPSKLRIHYGRVDETRDDDAYLCGACVGQAVEHFLIHATYYPKRYGAPVEDR